MHGPRSLLAGQVLALALAALMSGCGDDFIDKADPGSPAILVIATDPASDEDVAALFDEFDEAEAVERRNAAGRPARVEIEPDATARELAELALALERDERVEDVLVSVVDQSGKEVVQP